MPFSFPQVSVVRRKSPVIIRMSELLVLSFIKITGPGCEPTRRPLFNYNIFHVSAIFFAFYDTMIAFGEMAERFKAPVLKTGMGKLIVGSNPSLSAEVRCKADFIHLNADSPARSAPRRMPRVLFPRRVQRGSPADRLSARRALRIPRRRR